MKTLQSFLICFLFAGPLWSQQEVEAIPIGKSGTTQFIASGELGFLGAVAHKIQLGNSGTYFDYVEDGGQDVLFAFSRLHLEMKTGGRNSWIFLYQPLRLETEVFLREDVTFNDVTFSDSTGMRALYSFPFYRISYLREVMPNHPKFGLEIGGSLQIRNATISFESLDGSLFTASRNIGPVPAVKIRSRYTADSQFFMELEADGMYAPISYLNGSDSEVVGAIFDGSLRAGKTVENRGSLFLNARYLGGGAVGTSTDDPFPGDGYSRNWLGFLTISAGLAVNLR